jgi:tetratricopeptide (TPR) repeat protein
MSLVPLMLSLVLSLPPMQTRFVIIGSVREAGGGHAVGTIRITLLDENYQTIRTVFLDSSGRFQFRNVISGNYLVRVEAAGTIYEEETQSVLLQSLSARRTTTEDPYAVDFRLRRKGGQAVRTAPGIIFVQDVPPAARKEYDRAQNSFRDQRPEAAIEFLKKALEIFPDYFLALELLGSEYVKRDHYDSAVPVLLRAVEVNRDASRSLYALGVAHLKSNRPREAVEWLQRAADKDPKNPNVYMMKGLAYGKIGALSDAEESFKKAYAFGKSDVAEVHWYLAGIYDKQKRYSEAVRELELYLKEAKDIRDKSLIRGMIEQLRAKEKAAT